MNSPQIGLAAKRAVLKGPGRLEFEELPVDPSHLQDEEIYAETECSAVSVGTEKAAYEGQPTLRAGDGFPRLVGYCNVARVAKIGGGVTGVHTGDRIITHQSHQSAFVCSAHQVLAVVPETVPSPPASLTFLANLGLAALQKVDFQPGENVAVLGLGVIGLATTGVAAALGAHVLALGNDELRLSKASEMGAHLCLRSDDPDLLSRVERATGGVGIDVVITTANSWSAWRTALELPRTQGRIAVLGFPGRSEGPPPFNPLDPRYLYVKQLSVFAAGAVPESRVPPGEIRFNLQRNMELLLRLVRDGQLRLDKLITHDVPWHQLASVYERAARRDKSLIGAVLNWMAPEPKGDDGVDSQNLRSQI